MLTFIDYSVFGGMIIVCIGIGIYFGFCNNVQTIDEYLLGNRNMKVLPVALSLIASQVSGLIVLALPADIYVFGANYIWICAVLPFMSVLTYYIYMPVIIKLKSPSIFEYLELRFNRKTKIMASCIYAVQMLLFNPAAAYVPSLAFAQATGIHPHIITPIICTICIFYTTIGGFKAVVWTDVLQFGSITICLLVVVTLGVTSVGGLNVILEKALSGHRLDFNFSIDMTKRDGFWQMVVGGSTLWVYQLILSPSTAQKYISVKTLPNSKKVLILFCCGLITIYLFGTFTGIIMYTKFEKCDPILSGAIKRLDQLLPFFITEVAQNTPGLPGIFFAGICSASLSTLSANFNVLAATIFNDLIVPFFPNNVILNREQFILKLLVVTVGIICVLSTFLVDQIGSLLAFVYSMLGVTFGIFIGMYTLGIIFPSSNSKGVFWGSITSFLIVGTIAVLNQWYTLHGMIETFAKPVSIENCTHPINNTSPKVTISTQQPFVLFRLSFWFNPVISVLIVVVVGLLVSWFTNREKRFINSDLISPVSQIWLEKHNKGISHIEKYILGTACNSNTFNFENEL